MDTEDRLLFLQVNVNTAWTPAQRLAEEASMKERKQTMEDLPRYLQDYEDVFDKKEFDELPPR